ncbi:hypothetical protein GDO86_005254 [Hymenochirus boettgeri]|uniref:Cadherin domain-containing protein n=1 Tax=Hymenochirus boettgeri TaxID=247094 RepID=A0A8T2J1A3_9PIPI|nr:hypothetical protein GDO86_005254 [Hymenochirus boettgeri]
MFEKISCGSMQKSKKWQVISLILFLSYNPLYGQIQYSVMEEVKQGSVIGNIANDLNINVKELSIRKFHISSHDKKQLVSVNFENGDLFATERIDREMLCGTEEYCFLNLKAMIEEPLQIYTVKVEVLDINDNVPSFSKNFFEVEISESASPGARFGLGNAQDPDLGNNSVQSYGLTANEYFVLGEKINSDGSKYPELILEKPLDRERQSSIELSLTASDGGKPMKTGTALIKIVVHDSNDNYPVFSQDAYTVNVNENAPNGFLVLQLHATDEDDGTNAQIMYSFNHISENAQKIIAISSQSGEITKIGDMDYEVTKKYTLTVEAKDGGGFVSHCKVLIHVIDVNDNAPEIQVNSFSGTVTEDSPPETVIAIIHVHDLDSGENGEVLCHIFGMSPFQLISLTDSYYKIVTLSRMDRERTSDYNITITAKDKGFPPLNSNKTIHVTLTDVNDNIPTFEKANYITFIPENNQPGTSIIRVNALDLDFNENGHVIYSIINTDIQGISISSHVSINSATGVVYGLHPFDYEHLKDFEFQVMAKDNGSPSLSSNATVKVCIIDKNDNPPKILYPSTENEDTVLYEFVPRSSEKGYLVTKVIAVDADSGHNAWLSYHLMPIQESLLFVIGENTGEIRLSRDFQDTDPLRQKIVIMIKDNGSPSLSATVTINLVIGENFQILPEISNFPIKLENPSNVTFYLVIAIATISLLFILTVIGVVISKCRKTDSSTAFDKDMYPQVAFRYPSQVSDGTLPLPFSYDVCVAVDSSHNEFAYLKPNQNVPTENLIDTEDVSNSHTGEIIKTGELDYEVTKIYTITVEAKDGGGLISNCKVTIDVIDVNNNAPEIQINSSLSTIPEDSPPETVIAIIYVYDLDSSENGEALCQISEMLPFQLLLLTEGYYKIATSSRIDRERTSNYNITITAKDKGFPPLCSNKTLHLTLKDVIDNIPTFEKANYIMYIQENNQPGASITIVNALDLDINENGQIIYSIIDTVIQDIPISSHVSINSVTGAIYALHTFDYEQTRELNFQIMAKDNGSPLSSNATVRVCIIDKNDNFPMILYPPLDNKGTVLYECILYSSEKGNLVTKVIAVDADSGHNAWLSYHLLHAQEPLLFIIGKNIGEIRLSKEFQENNPLRQKIVTW